MFQVPPAPPRRSRLTLTLQAAVPKSMVLALAPPSSPVIPAGGSVTQQLEVSNPNKAVLKMKLKLGLVGPHRTAR